VKEPAGADGGDDIEGRSDADGAPGHERNGGQDDGQRNEGSGAEAPGRTGRPVQVPGCDGTHEFTVRLLLVLLL
jgi:hypothetical protein